MSIMARLGDVLYWLGVAAALLCWLGAVTSLVGSPAADAAYVAPTLALAGALSFAIGWILRYVLAGRQRAL